MIRLDPTQRAEISVEMRRAQMPTRAIADALGVGFKTVARDLSSVSDDTDDPLPTTVIGLDGRTRPATRHLAPSPPLACRNSGVSPVPRDPGAMRYELLPQGRIAEVAPDRCVNGHRLASRTCTVGWAPCGCPGGRQRAGAAGHRTWSCRTCHAVIYDPPCAGNGGGRAADLGLAPP